MWLQYLGEEMDEFSGRTYYEPGSNIVLPLLMLPGLVLVPGQTLPLHLFQPQVTEIDVIYTPFLKNFTSNSVLGLRTVNYNKQSTAIYLSTCIYAAIAFGTNPGNNPKSFVSLPVCCSITTCFIETDSFHQQSANNQTYCLKPGCLLHDLVFFFQSVAMMKNIVEKDRTFGLVNAR